ncbi:hypothetical protein M408DRAFT_313814 [Serendipita vermifera MAFF 305830]|uniref:DUF6533 domain-containing protein n=1 Tax=Serendipita vermifera MAFF 305830 TaxID=933852 RepID=A0A0C3B3S8_SERVB|nr:hypothetical protein M408DRAFT_313814 [Serendipita vermifera MAFF 305830]
MFVCILSDFEELWQQIVQGKDVLRASQYTLVASATFFIYDIILTFQDEAEGIVCTKAIQLELIWRRSLWTFPALLYIGNRYITLACILLTNYQVSPFRPAISKSFCKEGVTVVGFSVGVASWGGIMALRVAALWKTKRWVVWVVWLSWLVTVIALTAGALVVYISSLPTLMYNPVYGACTAMTTTHVQTALPAIQAIFVLILTFLTFAKAYQFPSRLRRLKDVSKLMVLLLRDGTLCFIVRVSIFPISPWLTPVKVVASLSLISGVSWMILPGTASPSRISMFVYLNWSIFSTMRSSQSCQFVIQETQKRFYHLSMFTSEWVHCLLRWDVDSSANQPVFARGIDLRLPGAAALTPGSLPGKRMQVPDHAHKLGLALIHRRPKVSSISDRRQAAVSLLSR